MKTDLKSKEIAGGSPTASGPKGKSKHRDDSLKGTKTLLKEANAKSEKGNMTQKKGYNETPATVPVKSSRKA